MLFAGSNTHTFASPINSVLARFGVAIDDCSDTCDDQDNDGYSNGSCGGNDCDDADPSINPGADELCGNEVDENCDGEAEECVTCTDADTESFYAESVCGTAVDCNDADAAINPGVAEICDNGVDDNCNNYVDEGCSCLPLRASCVSDDECCSTKCRGKKGGKICR